MLRDHPYQFTSDDVLFQTFAARKDFKPSEMQTEREKFFSKGQPCFRASPLTKRYGWGIHNNAEGKIAMYAVDSLEYEKLTADDSLEQTKAMRSKRA